LFGYSLETVYLTILIVIGCCTVLYLFFADIADASVDGIPFFDPAVIMSFITITAAGGYIFERFVGLSSIVNFSIAIIISAIFTALFYYFLLVPLRSAEVSLAYTDESLEGQVGKVIVPIPIDGFGEIVIETANGIISKRATSFQGEEIAYNSQVLVINMREGTAYVVMYENELLNL
jgi:membrane protein implicated in regulation of membrane protease activity